MIIMPNYRFDQFQSKTVKLAQKTKVLGSFYCKSHQKQANWLLKFFNNKA